MALQLPEVSAQKSDASGCLAVRQRRQCIMPQAALLIMRHAAAGGGTQPEGGLINGFLLCCTGHPDRGYTELFARCLEACRQACSGKHESWLIMER
jgi:hypothetical protein